MTLDREVAFHLLAQGVVELHTDDRPGHIVRQGPDMPRRLQRSLSLLSAICLEDGVEDKGCCVHDVLAMVARPPVIWDIPSLRDIEFHDVVLIDSDLGVPTVECFDLAGGGEVEIEQDIAHHNLRSALKPMPPARRRKMYSSVREFVVRNPVVSVPDLMAFVRSEGRQSISSLILGFYRSIPINGIRNDGKIAICDGCGGLLWPHPDNATFPHGRCHIRQCVEKAEPVSVRAEHDDPASFRLAQRSILAYWVSPGLEEILIHDALKEAGIDVVLYPEEDATDVGTRNKKLGIDVKAYSSPIVLARKLTQSVGRLVEYKQKYVAVPDSKLKIDKDYVHTLRSHYTGKIHGIVFDTSSRIIKKIAEDRTA